MSKSQKKEGDQGHSSVVNVYACVRVEGLTCMYVGGIGEKNQPKTPPKQYLYPALYSARTARFLGTARYYLKIT